MNKCSVTFTCDVVVRHGVLLGYELLRTKVMVHLRVLTLSSVPSLHTTVSRASGLKDWLMGEWKCSMNILRDCPSTAP